MRENETSQFVAQLLADYKAYPKHKGALGCGVSVLLVIVAFVAAVTMNSGGAIALFFLAALLLTVGGIVQYFVLRALWRDKRAKHFRRLFGQAVPGGSPQEKDAFRAFHDAITRDWASIRAPKAVIKGVLSALSAYEEITRKSPKTLEEFEPPFPPPWPGTEAQEGERAGFGRTASCTFGKTRFLFARSGQDLLVKVTTPRCSVGPVVCSPGFQMGLVASAAFGMGTFGFKDQNGQRWGVGVDSKEGKQLFKWLLATEDVAKAWGDPFVQQAVAALLKVAGNQPQPYLGAELEAPSGKDKVVFAWTAGGLFVYRQNEDPHPLFEGQCAVFAKEEFSFPKGTGSKAANLGLKIGGIGNAAAMRVVDRGEQTYCIVATKEAILPVLEAAGKG